MKRFIFGVLALCFLASACAGGSTTGAQEPRKSVPDDAVPGLLLSVADIDAIMGTKLSPHQPVSQMGDHRNLLPNLNCLGVWQVNEAPVYDPSHWKSVRQQMLRAPDTDQWETLVVQSVVSYRTAVAARDFFTQSADRWAKCTNHHVNIQLNNQQLPAWLSGELTRTDNQLAIPVVRGEGDQMRSCQRVLTTSANLIIDVQACKPHRHAGVTQAAAIADKIEASLPR